MTVGNGEHPGVVVRQFDVEPELARVFGIELAHLQLDHDIAQLLDVEEQEIDEEFVTINVERNSGPTK